MGYAPHCTGLGHIIGYLCCKWQIGSASMLGGLQLGYKAATPALRFALQVVALSKQVDDCKILSCAPTFLWASQAMKHV